MFSWYSFQVFPEAFRCYSSGSNHNWYNRTLQVPHSFISIPKLLYYYYYYYITTKVRGDQVLAAWLVIPGDHKEAINSTPMAEFVVLCAVVRGWCPILRKDQRLKRKINTAEISYHRVAFLLKSVLHS
jgi:hypothetical protein